MLTEATLADGTVVLRSPLLAALGIPHAFSTRRGPGGADFSLSSDRPANLAALVAALGLAGRRWCDVHQVHGTELCDAGACAPGAPRREADALVSRDPGLGILVRTADCVPVLLATRDGAAVAAIHAGWRGLAADIIPRTVAALGWPAGSFVACVGPCMGPEAFEVDEDVAAVFERRGFPALRTGWPKPHLHLAGMALRQLRDAGAAEAEDSGLCTYADDRRFFSFRRDKTHRGLPASGHQAALIAPR